MEENAMKHTKKAPLWYNPVPKDARRPLRDGSFTGLAVDREGRALLESYCRMYRAKL